MRVLFILAVLFFVSFVSYAAYADEFGDRFHTQTPQGLGDFSVEDGEVSDVAMEDISENLDNIMPASGEENSTVDQDISED